jgi:hypothetical protein
MSCPLWGNLSPERIFEISCDGQRVRGAVIPPVVDKDFARHGRIMAWPPKKIPRENHPSKKRLAAFPVRRPENLQ